MPVAMLTGDQDDVAKIVSKKVCIPDDAVNSRLLPNDKLKWISDHQSSPYNNHVMMIGDGINDAAALAMASVGAAMGAGGSAMAAQAADLVIMSDNLLRLTSSIQLCRFSRNLIIQNCVFAIGIKIIAVVLAIMGKLHFWHAILVDMGSLLVVIVNGVRPLSSKYYSNSNLDTVSNLENKSNDASEVVVPPSDGTADGPLYSKVLGIQPYNQLPSLPV